MQVFFTPHAAERMQQRLNTRISTGTKVDITGGFAHARTYLCKVNRQIVESWYCTIPNQRIVLIVSHDTRGVLTVMSQGPVVDAVYNQQGQSLQ